MGAMQAESPPNLTSHQWHVLSPNPGPKPSTLACLQELDRCDSSASVASREYTMMLRDMATLRGGRDSEGGSSTFEGTGEGAGEALADPFGYGFSDSGRDCSRSYPPHRTMVVLKLF